MVKKLLFYMFSMILIFPLLSTSVFADEIQPNNSNEGKTLTESTGQENEVAPSDMETDNTSDISEVDPVHKESNQDQLNNYKEETTAESKDEIPPTEDKSLEGEKEVIKKSEENKTTIKQKESDQSNIDSIRPTGLAKNEEMRLSGIQNII